LIAALAGAVLQHCGLAQRDWEALGRRTAVQLAYDSTIDRPSSNLNSTCLSPQFLEAIDGLFEERNRWKTCDENGVMKVKDTHAQTRTTAEEKVAATTTTTAAVVQTAETDGKES